MTRMHPSIKIPRHLVALEVFCEALRTSRTKGMKSRPGLGGWAASVAHKRNGVISIHKHLDRLDSI